MDEGLTPEMVMEVGRKMMLRNLSYLTIEERLAGLKPKERLAGMKPKDWLSELDSSELKEIEEYIKSHKS